MPSFNVDPDVVGQLSARFASLIGEAEGIVIADAETFAMGDGGLASVVEEFLGWSRSEVSELRSQMDQLRGLLQSTQSGYEQVEEKLADIIDQAASSEVL